MKIHSKWLGGGAWRVLQLVLGLSLALSLPLGAVSAAPGGAGRPPPGVPGANDPPGNIPRVLTLIQMGDIHGHP